MSKLTKEQQTSVLESHVTKIAKPMVMLVKDAKRFTEVLDEETLRKIELFLHARIGDMIRDLVIVRNAAPARTVFSLEAPIEQAPGYVVSQRIIPAETAEVFATPTTTAGLAAPTPSIPQPERKPWRKPVGRMVGTKKPVWDQPEAPRAAGDERTEVPDKTGYIAEAGFLDE